MEGAKKITDSLEKTSCFADNNNNFQNGTEIPAGAQRGRAMRTTDSVERTSFFTHNNLRNYSGIPAGAAKASSGLGYHDSFLPILLPSTAVHRKPDSCWNRPPSEWFITGNSSGASPAIGSSSANQPGTQGFNGMPSSFRSNPYGFHIDRKNEGSCPKKIRLENVGGGELPSSYLSDGCSYTKVMVNSDYLPTIEYPKAAGSSSSAGNFTSAVENASRMQEIGFGGRSIPVSPIELVPVMNSEPKRSAFEMPATFQTVNYPREAVPAHPGLRVYTGCAQQHPDNSRFLDINSWQYAEWVSQVVSPWMYAYYQAQWRTQMYQFHSLRASVLASVQYEVPEDGDTDDYDDDDDDDDDEDEDEDDDDDDEDDDDDDDDDGLEEETDEMANEEPEDGEEHAIEPGLAEEQIVRAMKTEKYKGTTKTGGCTICWEEYKEGEEIGMLDCDHSHKFHMICIKPWLMRQNSCPLCRMIGLDV